MEAGRGQRLRRVGPLHAVSVLVLLLLLIVTAASATLTHAAVNDQENRLLKERANEVNALLTNSVSSTTTQLALLAGDAVTEGQAGFLREARVALSGVGGTSQAALGLVVRRGSQLVVVTEVGPGITKDSSLSGEAATTVLAAMGTGGVSGTGVYQASGVRAVGLAYGAGRDMAVFRQTLLGPVSPPRQAGTSPFSELRVVLYASDRPLSSQVLVATTAQLPLRGPVRYVPLMVGSAKWLTAVSPVHPLVGSIAASAQWLVVGIGGSVSILVFFLLEIMARRRDAALEALDQEHHFAETLQRRLLPSIPEIVGLDVASSYVPGSNGQSVGGDWFDVFELPSGQVGLAIGDVMGHDVEAAAIMAQLRSALRSFASQGGEPSWVMEQLSHFVDAYAIPAIVTVVYGVLDPPLPDGSRRFVWANAGHLPPLLRDSAGRVVELDEGASPLLGAPTVAPRSAGERCLADGSMLVLYTDGLVEVRGRDLTVAVQHLRELVANNHGLDAETVCSAVLSTQLSSDRRDDIALLVIRVCGVHQEAAAAAAVES